MRFATLALLVLRLQDPTPPRPSTDTIVHRMGDVRWQHGGFITSIAELPGGKEALTAGYDGAVMQWDLESGYAIRRYEGHKGRIFSMALFPDGKRFVTGGDDKKVLLWEVGTPKPVRTFEGHTDIIRSVAVTSDGSRFVSGGHDSKVFVWNPESEKPVQSMTSLHGTIVSMALQPGGRLVLVDGAYKAALLDIDTGKTVRELSGTPKEIAELPTGRGHEIAAFTPDGRHAAVFFRGFAVTLWDVESGKEVGFLGSKGKSYFSLAFSRDGRQAFLGWSKAIEVWDVEKRSHTRSLPGTGTFFALGTTTERADLLATPGDGMLGVWDVESGKRKTPAGRGEILCVAATPDGKTILAGAKDGSIVPWEVATGRAGRAFDRLGSMNADGPPTRDWASSIAITPDGKRAVVGHWDCRAVLWDLATGKPVRQATEFGTSVQSVAINPDGRRAAGSGSMAAVWDLEGGPALRTFSISAGAYTAVAFTPDGKRVLLGSNSDSLEIFDASTGAVVRKFQGHPGRVVAIDVTPDGRLAVSASESGEPFQVWDVATGALVRKLELPNGTPPSWGSTLAMSPDGLYLFTRGPASELLVWNLESGRIVRSFEGHKNTVKSIAFSPGGRFVTTGSLDGTIIYRHPGLPLKTKSAEWAKRMKAADDDGDYYEKEWKRLMILVREPDFDAWTEAMERALALGDRVVDDLIKEFPEQRPAIDANRLTVLLKNLDTDVLEDRERATKELTDLGEAGYPWARRQMKNAVLSPLVQGALKAFREKVESQVAIQPMKDVAPLRAVLILLELPASESRTRGLEHFANGPVGDVAARLARRHLDLLINR